MKKSFSLTSHCTILLCTIIFFSFNSCSKENDLIKTDPIFLNGDKPQYAPLEIVTILASDNIFSTESFPAKINNIEIIISSGENSASFVLPNLNDGSYELTFILNNKSYIVPIFIVSLPNILSPDQYFNEIRTGMLQNIDYLNSRITELEENSTTPNEYEYLKNDAIKYTNLLNDYIISYNNLSSTEKQEFAKTMAANKAYIDEYNDLTTSLYTFTSSLRNTQSVEDYETGVENSKGAFVSSIIYTVKHIPFILAGANIATTLNPWVSAGAILATGMVTASFLINVSNTVSAAISLTTKSLKPFEFIMDNSQTIYESGVETVSDIKAKYRSLMDSDSNNGENGSTINTIVEKYNYLRDRINSFISELPSIFRPSYRMTSLKSTYNNIERNIYNQYVSITNVSNPNVTIQQINSPDGSIKIKATTTSTTDQTFTYDVNYTNSNFTHNLTKTVNAKVTTQLCDINTIIGTWTVEMYNTC